MLVDDTGKVMESSQLIFSDTLLTDRRLLRSFAKLDRRVRRKVRFNDDGRFQRYGMPYGWTRMYLAFIDGKGFLSGLSYSHP